MDMLKLYAPFISFVALIVLALKAKLGDTPFVTISRFGFDFSSYSQPSRKNSAYCWGALASFDLHLFGLLKVLSKPF